MIRFYKSSLCIGLIASLGVIALLVAFTAKSTPPKAPNILILFSDDHAQQAISAYGSPHIQTPNIDRIAAEGAIFLNAFCTNSICAPSRATLLTGKYSHINGHRDNRTTFDAAQDMFPKHLQKAGYQTAWIGKWHLVSNPNYFDFWQILPGQGHYYNPDCIQMDGSTVRKEGYATSLITDDALAWLKTGRDSSKPFCLVIGHKAPHRTWMPDTTDLRAFDGKEFTLPANFYDDYSGRRAAGVQKMSITQDMIMAYDLKVDDAQEAAVKRMNAAQRKAWNAYYQPLNEDFKKKNLSGKALDNWKYQRYMHDYMATIRSLDANIGRVLQYLDENGLAENTLVMYSSDQGFYLGEHGWFDKRFMYEESMRMPLLVRYPGVIKPGTEVSSLVMNPDYAPTFLQVAGIQPPPDMQGTSFLPLKNIKKRKSVYYHYYEFPDEHNVIPHFGVRTDRYKLIYFYGQGTFWELYDLKKDPNEMQNLYGKAGYEGITKALKLELNAQIKQVKDTEAQELLARAR